MGVVYRARDLSLDIDVALKLLRPELARRPGALDRFRSELLLARQVSSPHVVRIHDIAEDDGRWFISMDFIDGESLEGYRDRVGKIPADGALAITRALLDGLSAAHQRGVIHRDLKPANVLLDASGHAYITDFGVARSLGATGMTQSGDHRRHAGISFAGAGARRVGRCAQRSLHRRVDPLRNADRRAAVRRRNAGRDGDPAHRAAAAVAGARRGPDLPRWLHAFSDRLLKINPAHRFQSAKDALRALDTQRVPRPPTEPAPRLRRDADRRRRGRCGHVFLAPSAADPPDPRAGHSGDAARCGAAVRGARWRRRARRARARARSARARVAALGSRDRGRGARARARCDRAHCARRCRRGIGRSSLPDIATSPANATRILSGSLKHDGNGLALDLVWMQPRHGDSAATRIVVKGADAAALFAAYTDRAAGAPARRGRAHRRQHRRSAPLRYRRSVADCSRSTRTNPSRPRPTLASAPRCRRRARWSSRSCSTPKNPRSRTCLRRTRATRR